jgi:adenylyltransferase/sulfurtransferase
MTFTLNGSSLAAMHAHAREAYPDECCGMIIERDRRVEIVRESNIQNELHAQDPDQFPRTAATGYTMGPEAAPILIGSERGELRLLAIYHSHPEREAYFSQEDRRQALGALDEPVYPQAGYIVMSVRNREVRATKLFVWDAAARDYVEAQICCKRLARGRRPAKLPERQMGTSPKKA